MKFGAQILFALVAGMMALKILAWLIPGETVHTVWVGTGCPGGKDVVTSDLEDPAIRECKDARKHQYED